MSDRVSGVIATVLAIIVAGAVLITLASGLTSEETRLHNTSRQVAASIGRSIGDLIGRAVGLGIPLNELIGVDSYLNGILAANDEVNAIAIAAPNGDILFHDERSPGSTESDADTTVVSVPIEVNRTVVGHVQVTPAFVAVHRAHEEVFAVIVAGSILAGLICGVWFRLFRLENIDLPAARFVGACRAATLGHFGEYSTFPDGNPIRPLARAVAYFLMPVRRSARDAYALAEEIQAIDVMGTFTARVKTALAPLAGYRFDHVTQPPRHQGWGGWLVLPAVAIIESTRSLVAPFAADRIGRDPLAELFVGATISADALGRLLAIPIAFLIAARLPRIGLFFGLVMAGVGTGITYQIHDPYQFMLARLATGFGLWLAIWSLLTRTGTLRRLPWRAALILLCAWGVGPVFGDLLAEIVGRRFTFLIAGATAVVVAFIYVTEPWRGVSRAALRWNDPSRSELLAITAVSVALPAWLQLHLAHQVMPEAYPHLAMHFGLAAAAMSIPWWIGLRVPGFVGGIVAVAGLLAYFVPEVPDWGVSIAVGFGFGLTGMALGARGFVMSTATAMTLGLLIAGTANMLTFFLGGHTLLVSAAVTALLTAASMALALRPIRPAPIVEAKAG